MARGNARLLLLALADEANDEGFVTAYRRSLSHLVAKTLMAESTVREQRDNLLASGELERLRRGDGRDPSDYRLPMRVPDSGTLTSNTGLDEGAGIRHPGVQDPAPWVPNAATQGAGGPAPHHPVLSHSSPKAAAPKSPLPPLRVKAEEIVRTWWEAQHPRPVENFMGVVKIIQRCLEAGWEADAVAKTLSEVPCATVNAMMFGLRGTGRGRSAGDASAAEAMEWLEQRQTEEAS